jgi:lysophospholipase L1-like esterase
MVTYHKRIYANARPRSIIFFGDSLIQGLCVSCVTDNALNFGIGNDTTYGVYERLRAIKPRLNVKAIVLAIGINDLKQRNVGAIIPMHQKIIDTLPDNIPIILSAILPIDSKIANKNNRNNENIRLLNEELFARCANRTNCFFVNSGSKLIDHNGDLSHHNHIGDGIHLSPQGYEIWINDLRLIIEKYIV